MECNVYTALSNSTCLVLLQNTHAKIGIFTLILNSLRAHFLGCNSLYLIFFPSTLSFKFQQVNPKLLTFKREARRQPILKGILPTEIMSIKKGRVGSSDSWFRCHICLFGLLLFLWFYRHISCFKRPCPLLLLFRTHTHTPQNETGVIQRY